MDIASLRQYRIGPFAIFDTVASYLAILLIAPLLTKIFSKLHITIPLVTWILFMLPISVVFHLIFRQNTPLMKILLNPNTIQFYVGTIVLSLMTYLGVRKIKKLNKIL